MLDDGQSQAGAAHVTRTSGVHAVESFEETGQVLGIDARSGVGDLHPQLAASFPRPDGERGAGLAVLERVVREIRQHTLDGVGGARGMREGPWDQHLHPHPARGGSLGEGGQRLVGQRGQVQVLNGQSILFGLDPRPARRVACRCAR